MACVYKTWKKLSPVMSFTNGNGMSKVESWISERPKVGTPSMKVPMMVQRKSPKPTVFPTAGSEPKALWAKLSVIRQTLKRDWNSSSSKYLPEVIRRLRIFSKSLVTPTRRPTEGLTTGVRRTGTSYVPAIAWTAEIV